jgi:hypothetical protein
MSSNCRNLGMHYGKGKHAHLSDAAQHGRAKAQVRGLFFIPNAKIEFPLEIEDGYPPISVESLNARPVENGQFEILNTPFFVKNVAYGNCVTAVKQQDGRLIFEACTTLSGFKAISIILLDDSLDIELLDLLRGCSA